MTITPKISINDSNFVVHGNTILSGVPDNIMLIQGSGVGLVIGAFICTTFTTLHIFPVGIIEAIESYMQTFHHRERKKMNFVVALIYRCGWCTWDAFYTDVTAEGVDEGLKNLSEGGTSPRVLSIDDGWQQIGGVNKSNNDVVQEGAH